MDMSDPKASTMQDLAARLRVAMDDGNLQALATLLHPEVQWGPPGGPSTCRNKQDVVAWYTRAVGEGRRGSVNEVELIGDNLVVELVVHGTTEAERRGGSTLRWQVLAVRDGLVADIRGFDDHADALAAAGAGS